MYSPVTSVIGTKCVVPGTFDDHLLNGGVNGRTRGISVRPSAILILDCS